MARQLPWNPYCCECDWHFTRIRGWIDWTWTNDAYQFTCWYCEYSHCSCLWRWLGWQDTSPSWRLRDDGDLTDLTFMEVPESQDKNKRREGTSLYSDEGGYHEGADEFSESPLMKEIEEEGKKYFDKLISE